MKKTRARRSALARKTTIRLTDNLTGDSTRVDGHAGSVEFALDGLTVRADLRELLEGRNRFRLHLTSPMWSVLKISALGPNELVLEVSAERKHD